MSIINAVPSGRVADPDRMFTARPGSQGLPHPRGTGATDGHDEHQPDACLARGTTDLKLALRATRRPVRRPACRAGCVLGEGATQWHHSHLLTIEHDPDVLIALMELAITWRELEYSTRSLIAPEQWTTFAANHDWEDPDYMKRVFRLATNIFSITRSANSTRARFLPVPRAARC